VNVDAGRLEPLHERHEAGTVARDRGLELEPFARRHDRHPVPPDLAAHDHDVACSCSRRTGAATGVHDADPGRVDVQAVSLSALDNLRIAGNHRDAGVACRARHGRNHSLERRDGEPFLEHEASR
jgi:hypothetical protein